MRQSFRHGCRDAARVLLTLLVALATLAAHAEGPRASAQQTRDEAARKSPAAAHSVATRPRLVLLIAVDQFRYDYIERFGDLFAENGIRRLLREGASWTDANYDHVPTETAPGHATMLTGAWPSE